jgi:hypothetical protein
MDQYSYEELRQKSVKELRTILARRKVDATGIADKEEFVKLIMESNHMEPAGMHICSFYCLDRVIYL